MDTNIKTEAQPSQTLPFRQQGPERAHWLMPVLKSTRYSKLREISGRGRGTTRLFNTSTEFCYDSYSRM